MIETSETYLDVEEPFALDESVVEYNYHDYSPIVGTNLNGVNGEIRIVVENQDLFTHPHNSYLQVKGALVKADGTSYANTDKISFVNNAVAYMFSSLRYQIGDKTVDEINYPGFASTMNGIISYGPEDQAELVNRGWFLDSGNADAADDTTNMIFKHKHGILLSHTPKGSFAFTVPMSHLLGFFEDYTKILYGVKQTLVLMRAADANAIHRETGVAPGKIALEQLSWYIPHVTPSDAQKNRLDQLVDTGASVPVAFRHWYTDLLELPTACSSTWRLVTTSSIEKPRWIIVGFQTARDEDQKKKSGRVR